MSSFQIKDPGDSWSFLLRRTAALESFSHFSLGPFADWPDTELLVSSCMHVHRSPVDKVQLECWDLVRVKFRVISFSLVLLRFLQHSFESEYQTNCTKVLQI